MEEAEHEKKETEMTAEKRIAEYHGQHATELAQLEDKLRKEHNKEMEALKERKNEEMLTRMEELRQKMVDSSQLSVGRLRVKLEKEQEQKISLKEEEMKA